MNYLRVIFCLSQRHTGYDRELIFMLFRIFNHFCLSRPLVNDKRFADHVSSFLDVQVEKKQCKHGNISFVIRYRCFNSFHMRYSFLYTCTFLQKRDRPLFAINHELAIYLKVFCPSPIISKILATKSIMPTLLISFFTNSLEHTLL